VPDAIATPAPIERPQHAAAAMIGASACFATMGMAVKHATAVVSSGELVFWRSLVATIVVALVAGASGAPLRPVNVRMHLVRAVVGVGSMWAYFYGISRLQLGDAVLLTYLSPLFVALFSPKMVGEHAPRAVWAALPVGFLGVAMVAGAHGAWDGWGVAAALSSAVMSAVAYLSVRTLARTDGAPAVVFWFGVLATAITAPALLWTAVPAHPAVIADLLVAGVGGAAAQLLMTWAYANAPAAKVAVYAYLTPVFAYGLGIAILGDPLGPARIVGVGLVLLAGAFAVR
jgi:drug/metabolite transporter (DMT)-like permease